MLPENPTLSVRLMVYNNAGYIREALDGILMQQVDFSYEIVIGDDFSTDGTLDILNEYRELYPDKVRILDRPHGGKYEKDRKRLGRIHNFVDIVNHCQGKYVAILDGDDYWTDPQKLQLQVDFLEQNPEFSICFHQATELRDDGTRQLTNEGQPEVTDGAYLLRTGWHMRSASIVFRRSELPAWPEWIYTIESMDYNVQCMLTRNGQKIRYFDRPMCVYRIHEASVSARINRDHIEIMERNLYLLRCIKSYQTKPDHIRIIEERSRHIETQLLYHIRARKKRTLKDWKRIFQLAWNLGKFKPANVIKVIRTRTTAP